MIDSRRKVVEVHPRAEDGTFESKTLRPSQSLVLPELGIEIPIDEFYIGVELT